VFGVLEGPMLAVTFFLTLAMTVLLTAKYKIHAFIAILTASLAFGLLAGIKPADIAGLAVDGAGKSLGYISLIVLFAMIIGEFLESTGSALTISRTVTQIVGIRRAPVAMALSGFMIAVPVMCNDTAFIIMAPVAQALALGTGFQQSTLLIALAAGAYTSFKLIFPAAPLYPATVFGADAGKVLMLGLVTSVPVFLIGLIWALKFSGARQQPNSEHHPPNETGTLKPPSPLLSFMPVLLPITLILAQTLLRNRLPTGAALDLLDFMGNPVVALLTGVISALAIASRKASSSDLTESVSNGIRRAAPILAIVGAGGAFGKIIEVTAVGTYLGKSILTSGFPSILVPFLVAAAIKTAQGSSMVTMVTAPTIVLPLLPSLGISPVVAAMALSAGALVCVNINDSFFWVVTGVAKMDTSSGLRTLTLLSIIQGIVALTVIALVGGYFA